MKKSDAATDAHGLWFVALRDYIQDKKAKLCPSAQRPMSESGRPDEYAAWGVFDEQSWLSAPEARDEYGSVGFNDWCYNEPTDWKWNQGDVNLDWRSLNVRSGSDIPVLLDSVWIGGKPEMTDNPPEFKNYWAGSGLQMKRFCIDRHVGFLNCVFMDMSVRKVGLKELWKLKWHRNYPVDRPLPVWPDWMAGMKDYE
jgi:hypothetical protein